MNNSALDLNSICDFISKHRNAFVYLFYLAVLLVAYSPVFTNVYAYSDDFLLLPNSVGIDLVELLIRQGRPLNAFVMHILRSFTFSIEDFVFMRITGLLGIIFCTCFLYWLIIKLKVFRDNICLAVFVPLLLFLLPSVQVFVGWSQFFYIPISSILPSLMSYYLIRLAQDEPDLRLRMIKAGFSVLLIIISFSFNQITAMIFVIALIAEFCLSKRQIKLKEFAYPFIVLCIGMLLSLAMVKLLPPLLHLPLLERGRLNLNPIDILQWLRSKPLTLSIQNYSVFDSSFLTAISKIFIISGYVFAIIMSDDWKTGIFKAFAIPSLIIFSILPTALTSQDTDYRTMISLAMAVALLLLYGLINWGFIVFKSVKKEKLFFLAPFILILITSIVAQKNIIQRYVLPFDVEYRAFAAELSKLPKDRPIKIAFLKDGYECIYTHLPRTTDFGNPNLQIFFAAPTFAKIVIVNKGLSNISLYEKPFIEDKKDIPPPSDDLYIINVDDFVKQLQIKL